MIKRLKKISAISAIIPNVLNPIKEKSNIILEMKLNWGRIFNEEFSNFCSPKKILNFNNKKTILVEVMEEKLLEISYNSEFMIQEINRFYGHNYIELIKFKKKNI